MKKLASYMFRGLILLAPISITLYILVQSFLLIDDLMNDVLESLFQFRFRGLGMLAILTGLTLIGMLSNTLLFRPIANIFDGIIKRTPFIRIIYSSIRDLFTAFSADKKKFTKPVLVNMYGNDSMQRIGFITHDDMSRFGLTDKVAVFFPHSYNFSGNLFLVNKQDVKLWSISPTEALKFAISGGITEIVD